MSADFQKPRAYYNASGALAGFYNLTGAQQPLPDGGGGGGASYPSDAYQMPAPNGTNDDAALTTALASSAGTIVFQAGTYLLGSTFSGVNRRTIQGQGRDRTTLKLRDGANIDYFLQFSASATELTFRDFTWDSNTAGQASGAAYFANFFLAASRITIERCRFINLRSANGIGAFGNGCNNYVVRDNIFEGARFTHLCINGAPLGRIERNRFSDWNIANGGAQMAILLQGSAETRDILIADNDFSLSRECTFSVESVPDTGVLHPRIVCDRNRFWGNTFRGNGISGYFADSVFTGNFCHTTADPAGAWYGWRSGIEIFGTRCTIADNTVINGSITMSARLADPLGVGCKVQDNRVTISSAAATSVSGILLALQQEMAVQGNTVDITTSGSATFQSGIFVGTYGDSGVLTRSRVTDNIVVKRGGATGNGIRELAPGGGDALVIADNTVTGCLNGITVQSNALQTNMKVVNNMLVGNTTAVNGTPTGSGTVITPNYT